MTWVGLAIAALVSLALWQADAYLALRKRVAKLENKMGTEKPDRLAEFIPEPPKDS